MKPYISQVGLTWIVLGRNGEELLSTLNYGRARRRLNREFAK